MKERPIIFSAPMVRAILEGRKTQTRRVVKPRPAPRGSFVTNSPGDPGYIAWCDLEDIDRMFCKDAERHWHTAVCPYGVIGDRLWVRETCQPVVGHPTLDDGFATMYRADGALVFHTEAEAEYMRVAKREAGRETWPDRAAPGCWKPSIYMPRWASRITLEIADVRVERLQDISEEDARAEGVDAGQNMREGSCRDLYSVLWDSINGDGAWASNPWVWALTFKRGGAA